MQIWEVESPLLSEQANGTVPTQWSVVRVFFWKCCVVVVGRLLEMVVNAAFAASVFFFFLCGKQSQQTFVACFSWKFPSYRWVFCTQRPRVVP